MYIVILLRILRETEYEKLFVKILWSRRAEKNTTNTKV